MSHVFFHVVAQTSVVSEVNSEVIISHCDPSQPMIFSILEAIDVTNFRGNDELPSVLRRNSTNISVYSVKLFYEVMLIGEVPAKIEGV